MNTRFGDPRVWELVDKGVTIADPWTISIGPEVSLDQISGEGVVLHPGTRVRGAATVISAGSKLSTETPMTIEDCQLGPGVELAGGYASGAVFLEGASMGSGAHVRGGSILEEHAWGAHTVGLKQTILFPHVTLGSLINFCDALMAGGTDAKNHSEVGSSYIHFNFTPDGDKTTASLFGDVPYGVLVNQRPVFLGGQGGAVGPVTTGFGVVVGAGSVLRADVDEDDVLIIPEPVPGMVRPNKRHRYKRLNGLLEKNLRYIGSLVALQNWYAQARAPFFAQAELGDLVLQGALAALRSGHAERVKRLKALIGKLEADDSARAELIENASAFLAGCEAIEVAGPTDLLDHLRDQAAAGQGYLPTIQSLDETLAASATSWLTDVIDQVSGAAAAAAPQLGLFAS